MDFDKGIFDLTDAELAEEEAARVASETREAVAHAARGTTVAREDADEARVRAEREGSPASLGAYARAAAWAAECAAIWAEWAARAGDVATVEQARDAAVAACAGAENAVAVLARRAQTHSHDTADAQLAAARASVARANDALTVAVGRS